VGRLNAFLFTLLCLAAVATVGLASCGGSDANLLPGGTASEINSNLEKVRELNAEGECIGAEEAVQEVSTQVDGLGDVAKSLKLALREGTEKLAEVVSECEESEETAPAIEPAEVPEAEEKSEKPEKEKKPKPPKEPVEEAPEEEAPPKELPPQSHGEGKGLENGNGKGPPEETPSGDQPSSGGVGPGTPAEGE
jgi:outer membrane biosynthesis protein TonB